jgi:hypothetical protein
MLSLASLNTLVSGSLRFRDKVARSELLGLAVDLSSRSNGFFGIFLELHILQTPPGYVLSFVYRLPVDGTEAEFTEELTDKLKRKFGNDLCGWSIGQPFWKLLTPLSNQVSATERQTLIAAVGKKFSFGGRVDDVELVDFFLNFKA